MTRKVVQILFDKPQKLIKISQGHMWMEGNGKHLRLLWSLLT
jgi:hypothetical protein